MLLFLIVLFSTARTASTNTSSRFCFLIAEHSTRAKALIFVFSFFPSAVVTYRGDSGIRRSDLVPAIMGKGNL